VEVEVRLAGETELPLALALRHRVFVDGQGVPAELEEDGLDATCLHWLARVGEAPVPIGAARARWLSGRRAKVERVAVEAAHRRCGVGARIMAAVEAELAARGAEEVVLSSQRSAERFYAELGYRAEGEPFFEAGIEHVFMRKLLRSPRQTG